MCSQKMSNNEGFEPILSRTTKCEPPTETKQRERQLIVACLEAATYRLGRVKFYHGPAYSFQSSHAVLKES